MIPLENSLIRITTILTNNDIPYMLIGGYAMAIHGFPRMTQDLDISLGIDIDQIDQVLKVVTDDFNILVDDPVAFAGKTNVLLLQDKNTDIRIDLIFSFIAFERDAIANAKTISINGVLIKNVSLNNLLVYKMLAGRERDKEDVATILFEARDEINVNEVSDKIQNLSEIIQNDSYTNWKQLLEENKID